MDNKIIKDKLRKSDDLIMANNLKKSLNKYLHVRISKKYPTDIRVSFDDYIVMEEAEPGDRVFEYELFLNTETGEMEANMLKDSIY